ncbi:MAG: EAL domain-containing protein, partial [Gammaproteobacteria bacterium]|nr:EAL domain-containing protein [Gammaproteobacteria bacterium]
GTDQITPLAETIGVMGQISDWMLQQGCRFAHNLSAEHGPPPALAITLTEREFARPDLIDRVAASLDDAGLDRKRLQLEITERALMRFRQGPARIRQLKALGLRVALDNFGSGHVSLSALAALPIDALKIDRQFSQIMGSDAVSQRFCAAVIALGRELGLTVIAKGIENPVQHALLVELGCDAGQGLLFSQPLAPGEIPAFLASQGNLPQPSPVA